MLAISGNVSFSPNLLSRSPRSIAPPLPGGKRVNLCEENQYVSRRALDRTNELATA